MRRLGPVLAWSLAVVTVGLVASAAVLGAVSATAVDLFILFPILLFASVGALVASRRPDNAIGWLFSLIAFSIAFSFAGQAYAERALILVPGSLPAGVWMAWISGWIGSVGFALIFSFLPLLFPDGRPPSLRWRPVAWLALAMVLAFAAIPALQPGPLAGPSGPERRFAGIENPLGIEVVRPFAVALFWPSRAFGLFVIVLCSLSLVARYRGAGSMTRQQLKWFGYAASALALVLLTGNILQFAVVGASIETGSAPPPVLGLWWGLVFPLAVGFVPIAAGIAVLRYRLYDIDVLINRTLIYGLTSGAIVVTFLASVAVLQALLRSFTGGSELAIAASTLASVALAQPIRRRVQEAVDRRFYRSRYDAARTLEAFSIRLRGEVDLDAVRAELVSAVRDTVQPAHASVWLRR